MTRCAFYIINHIADSFQIEIVCLVKLQITKLTNGSCLVLHNGLNFCQWNKHWPEGNTVLLCERGKMALETSSVGEVFSPVQDSKAHSSSTGMDTSSPSQLSRAKA